jgi:hypothetical protein
VLELISGAFTFIIKPIKQITKVRGKDIRAVLIKTLFSCLLSLAIKNLCIKVPEDIGTRA